jgi:hypothetical protein
MRVVNETRRIGRKSTTWSPEWKELRGFQFGMDPHPDKSRVFPERLKLDNEIIKDMMNFIIHDSD